MLLNPEPSPSPSAIIEFHRRLLKNSLRCLIVIIIRIHMCRPAHGF